MHPYKYILVLSIAVWQCLNYNVYAQSGTHSARKSPGVVYENTDKPIVYPGGIESLRMHLAASIHPLRDNVWNDKEYKYVTVEFVAGRDGKAYGATICPTSHINDKSFKRPIEIVLERFKPATLKGRTVNSRVSQTLCLDDYSLDLSKQDAELFQEGEHGPYRVINDIMVIDDDRGNEVITSYSTSGGRTASIRKSYEVRELERELELVWEDAKNLKLEYNPTVTDNRIYTSVEQMPSYPGGEAGLFADIAQNIHYPAVCLGNGIQGKVTVQFVVTTTGTVGEVRIIRGADPDLDKEAKRVVKTLKKFTPGKMSGSPVNVWYTLPITFKLRAD